MLESNVEVAVDKKSRSGKRRIGPEFAVERSGRSNLGPKVHVAKTFTYVEIGHVFKHVLRLIENQTEQV